MILNKFYNFLEVSLPAKWGYKDATYLDGFLKELMK